MYRVNSKRLRQLIDDLGDFGLAMASQGARVSVSLLEKMYAGTYKNSPRDVVRERLANFFGVRQEELFDRVGGGSKKRAS